MPAHIDIELDERIALVTLNRPEARNSLTRQLMSDLISTITALDRSDEVDVMVLTGTDPVFCAGLDLKELEPGGSLDIPVLTNEGNPWPRRSKPLIGAINGPAVTGGLELALTCDILVASERARFGDTHARVGLLPFWGMTVRLPQMVGSSTALLMSLTGNFLTAPDAHRLGMVSTVVAHDELLATARQLARDIASADQPTVRALLQSYRESLATEAALRDEVDRAIAYQGEHFDAEAFARRREAITARGRAQR